MRSMMRIGQVDAAVASGIARSQRPPWWAGSGRVVVATLFVA